MKRITIIGLVVVLLMSMLLISTASATTYGTITGGWLRLRSSPSFSSTIYKSYNTGTVVEILATSGSWYQVKAPDGYTGYMYSSYVTIGGGGTGYTAYVTSSNGLGVRLRSGPSKGYRVLAVYSVGTEVTVLQTGILWSRIQVGSTVGYMMSEFLTTSPGPIPTTTPSGDMATVRSDNGYGVRLRSGPGTGYSIIGLYSVGTRVSVITRGTDWDYIQVGSRLGYMMNYYLTYDTPTQRIATGITVTAASSSGMQGEYVALTPSVTGTNLSSPAYTLAVTGNSSMAEISGTDLHILSTATVGASIVVTATTVDNNSSGSKITATCTVTVTAAQPRVTAFSFDETAVTVSIAGGSVQRRIGYSISGYNLSTPSFSLTVPSSVSAHVTASIDTVNEEVVVNVADTITAGTMFTITGTTTDNDSGGTQKVATITFTVTDTVVTLSSIELVPTLSSVRWDQTSQINATLHYSDGSSVSNVPLTTKYTLAITSGTAATLSGKTLLPDTTLIGVPNETVTVTGTAVDDPTKTDTAVITIVARNVPGTPALNTAVAGNGSVTLDWDTQTDDGGAAITGYIVSYTDDPVAAKTVGATTGASTTDAIVSGLTNGTTYYFYLQATNSQGNSAYSAYKTATPTATVPSAPTAITVMTESDQSVAISWGPPTTDGGSALTKYRVNYSNGGAETLFLDNIDPATTTANVTGLTNGTTYTFYVYAFNSIGASVATTTTGTPATNPSAPQSLTVTSFGDASVSLSWNASSSTGGSAITAYTVYYDDGGGAVEFTRSNPLALIETVTGLTNGTPYTFTVYAVNAKGTSAAATTTSTPSTVPGTPTALVVTAHDATSVSLSWGAPASTGGSALTAYTITYNGGTEHTFTRDPANVLNTTEIVTGLTTATSYTFSVYAVNANGSCVTPATVTQLTD